MVTLKQAVKALTGSYGDIKAEAKTYSFDYDEVKKELDKADPDSAEGVVLNLLLQGAVKATKAAKADE